MATQAVTTAAKPDFWDKTWTGAVAVIQAVAPVLATAVGGPLAGTAVQALSTALFGDPAHSASDVSAAINAGLTPAQLLSVQTAENQFKLDMENCQINIMKISEDGIASARTMQIANKDPAVDIVAYATVIGFLGMVSTVLLGYAKVDGAVAGTLVGLVAAKAGDVYHFLFGSSASSNNKDNLLAQSTPASDP
jgi:hypothetical protein